MVTDKGRRTDDEEEEGDEDEDTQKDKFMTFRLGREEYGLAIEHVTEIVGMQRITEVPDLPDFIRGVINLRGQVIPVIDVRARFRMEPRPYDDRTCVIVIQVAGLTVGLIVDAVNEVVTIPETQIAPPPLVAAPGSARFIRGLGKVGEHVKILLDAGRLLRDGEWEQLAPMALHPAG